MGGNRSGIGRCLAVIAGLGIVLVSSFVVPASASTSVSVQMSFTEQEFSPSCSLPDGYCGTGVVKPFGKATETIRFEAGCDGGCDLRTVYLPEGTLLIEESLDSSTCPGSCGSMGAGRPERASFVDVVIGGTGIFAGSSGSLDGFVRASGDASLVQISGSILLSG